MKKITAFILSGMTALFSVGCANDESSAQSSEITTTTAVTTTASAPAVDTSALEAKFLGRWHCVGTVREGTDSTEEFNTTSTKELTYGIGHRYSLVMEDLGHGYIYDDVVDDESEYVHLKFEKAENALEGYIKPGNFYSMSVFVWISFTEISASTENDRLVISSGEDKLIFERGESPEAVDYDKAERLKYLKDIERASQSAFDVVNNSDVDPENNVIIKKDRSPVKLKDLDKNDFIENGVYYSIIWNLKYPEKAEEYYVCWEIDEEMNEIIYAQASATLDEGYVAQYPYPYMPYSIDLDAKHKIGTKF